VLVLFVLFFRNPVRVTHDTGLPALASSGAQEP
jgi:hypothetical protein